MDRIKIRLDVDGNLSPIDQMAAKFKVADRNVEELIGSIDKLNSKSITLQVKEQIANHRANDPLFKRIDFMPDKSIKPLPAFDMLANIKNQVEENKKKTATDTTDLIAGVIGAVAGGGGISSKAALLGGILGGPIGAAIGLLVGKVVGALGDILVGAMKKTGEQLLSFAKSVIESAAYREDNINTLSKFTGSDESAKREFDYVTRMADKTAFSTKQIGDLTTRLFTLGFKANEVDTLRGRALDIATLKQNNPLVLEQYADAVNKIRGVGKYNAKAEVLDLIEKQLPGNARGVRLQIGKELALKGDEKSILTQVEKLIKHGKVSDTVGINAINHLIEKTAGGTPGSYAKEFATKSLSGAISNVQDAFSNNLLRVDWSKSPGMNGFRKFLVMFADTLGSKEFQEVLEHLAEALFKGFGDIKKENIIKWFEKFEGALLMLVPAIDKAWEALQKILSGEDSLIGGFLSGFADVAELIGKLLIAGVVDALPGGNHDNVSVTLENYKKQKENDFYAEQDRKIAAAQKKVDEGKGNFVELRDEPEKFNMVKNVYNIKVDARGKGKSVIDEVNTAAERARKASGR